MVKQPWERLEDEYVRYRELRIAEKQVSDFRHILENVLQRPGQKYRGLDRSFYERALAWWEDIQRVLTGEAPVRYSQEEVERDIASRREKLRAEYIASVTRAIRSGQQIPEEIIRQRPEFQKAKTARQRYEKGRHTSFANRSAAVTEKLKPIRGFKAKRQDGKPITEEQLAEIEAIIDDVEAVLGPIGPLLYGTDITIAHTNGKHPFLSKAGGLWVPGETTISIGVRSVSGRPIRAGAHELGHWLDYSAGAVSGVEVSGWAARGRRTKMSSIAEAAIVTQDFLELHELLVTALARMNSSYTVRRLFKKDAGEHFEEELIERARVHLGHYWREPREIWARLFEQFIATELGREGAAVEAPEWYESTPGWWSRSDFLDMKGRVERQIRQCLDTLRSNLPIAEIEAKMQPRETAQSIVDRLEAQIAAATDTEEVVAAPVSGDRAVEQKRRGEERYEQGDLFGPPQTTLRKQRGVRR